MVNKLIRVSFYFLITIISIFALLTSTVLVGGVEVNKEIEEFKNRGVYIGTYNIGFGAQKVADFYEIKKQYDYEYSNRRIYSKSSCDDTSKRFTDIHIGDVGDIYLASRDPLGTFYTAWGSKKIIIGHCGIVYDEYAKYTYEIVGNQGKANNVAKLYFNTWVTSSGPSIAVLRTKQEINKDAVREWLENHEGCPYNFIMLLKAKNKYYCSDLVSRCLEESNNVKVSSREVLVSGGNMLLNDNTYLIYYREQSTKNNVDYNIYFLSDEENNE